MDLLWNEDEGILEVKKDMKIYYEEDKSTTIKELAEHGLSELNEKLDYIIERIDYYLPIPIIISPVDKEVLIQTPFKFSDGKIDLTSDLKIQSYEEAPNYLRVCELFTYTRNPEKNAKITDMKFTCRMSFGGHYYEPHYWTKFYLYDPSGKYISLSQRDLSHVSFSKGTNAEWESCTMEISISELELTNSGSYTVYLVLQEMSERNGNISNIYFVNPIPGADEQTNDRSNQFLISRSLKFFP